MTRNLKALGLALIAVFATSAMIASAAQANPNPLHATCAEYPCVITGESIEGEVTGKVVPVHHFVTPVGKIVCTTTKFDATIESAAKNTEVTVTPTYSGCTAGGLPTTVTMNGCDYRLHGGVEDAEHHFIEGTTTIICPEGKKIEVHVYSTETKHKNKESLCTITILPQTAGGVGNTFTNTTSPTPDDVDLVTDVTVNVTIHGSTILCKGGIADTEHEYEAAYTGVTTLKAYEDLGNHTNEAGETVYTEGSQIGLTISEE